MKRSSSIGQQIRQLRQERNLTLDELAGKCQISTAFLSQIERSQSNPSVATLYALSDALGISIASFFNDAENNAGTVASPALSKNAQVVRGNQRKILIYPGSEIKNELLSPDFNRAIQLMRVVMPPGTDTGNEPFIHAGEECGIILQGCIETRIGDEVFILEAGDTIYHSSTVPHSSRNIGDTEAIMIVAKTPPSIDF
ncbi:MAG: helix-turn-helix domain-containing protein [Chloroflexota bacterium]